MAAYLQQGHGSWGLLEEPEIGPFKGLVLSPVNDGPDAVRNGLQRLKNRLDDLEVILDPQLYNPSHEKGKLAEWGYYTADFETADHSDRNWWAARGREVVDAAAALELDAICSPALVPRAFTDDYYRLIVEVADETAAYAREHGIETLITAIVPLRDLANPDRAHQIASVLSGSDCDRIYLSFYTNEIEPRQPLNDAAALATAIHLVRLLSTHFRVHVAFCGHDLVLWKFAGAADVSAGKFFNLRRFTPARWRDEEGGGRLVSYWNESTLFTLLRDQEVLRLDRLGWFATRTFAQNPHSAAILETLRGGTGAAWQKLSWLQFLRWVATTDVLFSDPAVAEKAVERADVAWGELAGQRILFTDRWNDGSHIRVWLNAMREGSAR
ncbi:MAG: hypothetical protein EON54_11475 [Alcaligenaceae bacterium]|nr:MAG: hypothetical protein EON54_11475 [Alcaligenaceae bacterium]